MLGFPEAAESSLEDRAVCGGAGAVGPHRKHTVLRSRGDPPSTYRSYDRLRR